MRMLGPNDQMFLWLERRNQPMHIGGLQLLTPPGDPSEWFHAQGERLRKFTQAQRPFDQQLTRRMGTWFWKEDKDFDLEGHFRLLALPPPGRIRELLALVSQLHSAPLDRGRPLWEFYLIDGVEGGRVAIYSKIHHALVDGVAATRMLMKSMTEDADQGDIDPLWAMAPRKRDAGAPKKDRGALLAQAFTVLKEQASTLPKVTKELWSTLKEARSNPDYVSAFQAPRCLLNQRITGSRRFAAQSYSLTRIRDVGKKHDATVNDVMLAMCASALRRYLLDLDALPEKPLIAMVPTSLRRDESESGNQVGMLLANLGTHLAEPLERLGQIKRSVKLSKERLGRMNQAEIINYLAAIMAPSGINMATGIAPRWQAFNVTISNVPGPKKALYWNGAKMEGTYPVSIVLDGQALNITLTSYVDKLEVGLIACRRTLPRMQRLLEYLEQGLAELEEAAA